MKKTGTGWRGFLTLSLAAALAGAAPAGALAASPEFARTPEEWERLRDNTLEYEEIPDLIREYNSTVQNNMISYGDYRGKDANEIAEDYREAAQTLYDSVVWPSEDDTGYAMLYSAAETAQAQARQLEKMADENVSDGMIIKWQYDQVEASLSSTAQNLMSQYYQLLENRKTAEAGKELAEASLRSVETQASLGMATENDVLTAREAVKTAEAGVISAESNIQSVKQNLQVMTGWAYNSEPEIAQMPPVDVTRIDAMNPETDLEKALENNYTLLIAKRTLENTSDAANQQIQRQTIANTEQQIASGLTDLYSQVLQARNTYDQARSALELEEKNMAAAETKYGLGMISRLEYLQARNAYVESQANFRIQELALQSAMDAYDWALRGNMVLG
ncbi:MAG TPA: TolC family protein [Candidatus Lachnoclostridium stercoripullorum]|uniref:TolC family protein n=1 Tax=Candidatus Lachnoclostridium stercoripullorum TaxID=2838635 RepID=A0A9D1W551_9FIRM|nr:TolC family protein [Candidatus Lachnoclostridium stercoripullorum]